MARCRSSLSRVPKAVKEAIEEAKKNGQIPVELCSVRGTGFCSTTGTTTKGRAGGGSVKCPYRGS